MSSTNLATKTRSTSSFKNVLYENKDRSSKGNPMIQEGRLYFQDWIDYAGIDLCYTLIDLRLIRLPRIIV